MKRLPVSNDAFVRKLNKGAMMVGKNDSHIFNFRGAFASCAVVNEKKNL